MSFECRSKQEQIDSDKIQLDIDVAILATKKETITKDITDLARMKHQLNDLNMRRKEKAHPRPTDESNKKNERGVENLPFFEPWVVLSIIGLIYSIFIVLIFLTLPSSILSRTKLHCTT